MITSKLLNGHYHHTAVIATVAVAILTLPASIAGIVARTPVTRHHPPHPTRHHPLPAPAAAPATAVVAGWRWVRWSSSPLCWPSEPQSCSFDQRTTPTPVKDIIQPPLPLPVPAQTHQVRASSVVWVQGKDKGRDKDQGKGCGRRSGLPSRLPLNNLVHPPSLWLPCHPLHLPRYVDMRMVHKSCFTLLLLCLAESILLTHPIPSPTHPHSPTLSTFPCFHPLSQPRIPADRPRLPHPTPRPLPLPPVPRPSPHALCLHGRVRFLLPLPAGRGQTDGAVSGDRLAVQ